MVGEVHIFLPTAALCGAVCLLLTWKAAGSSAPKDVPEGFRAHQTRYLIAWVFAITGEWLNGPGVYALYASYGFTYEQTGQLFVLGFLFSSVLGCFAGRFADSFGRKRSAMLYCSAGIIANACKHVPWLPALFVGRLFDGLHASLLYTAFESWLVGEHIHKHKFSEELLGHTFGLMYRFSYFSAILCGFIAQRGVDAVPEFRVGAIHFGRWGVPLEASALCQLASFIFIAFNWDENYGTPQANLSPGSRGTRGVLKALKKPSVQLCGLMVSFMESSLFIFVFTWTPSLSPEGDQSKLPCGTIFAVYMMACMSGASAYSIVSNGIAKHVEPAVKVFVVVSMATVSLLVPAIMTVREDTVAYNFIGFVMFEFCVGAYFPSAGAMKSDLVDEAYRTTIYNIFRTPMNIIVVAVILMTPSQTNTWRLMFCMLLSTSVALGAYCYYDTPAKRGEPLLKA